MFVPFKAQKEGQAGPSKQPERGQKRKDFAMMSDPEVQEDHAPVSRDQAASSKKPKLAQQGGQSGPYNPPSQSQQWKKSAGSSRSTQGPPDEIIELSDDDTDDFHDDTDGEELVRFKYGSTTYPEVKKSAVLPFVKKQACEIFLRRLTVALKPGEKKKLERTANTLMQISKDLFIDHYKTTWAQQLRSCVNTLTAELAVSQKFYNALERREDEFSVHIFEPLEQDLQEAQDDADNMTALVKFLVNN